MPFDGSVFDANALADALVADAFINMPPIAFGQEPDLVLGQVNFTTATPTSGGLDGSSMAFPDGAASDGTRLWISDGDNRRVLQWNGLPIVNKASANLAVGQTSLTFSENVVDAVHCGPGCYPFSDGTRLVIADSTRRRVLIFSGIPQSSGTAASIVVGQVDFTSATAGTTPSKLSSPKHAIIAGGGTSASKLIVADTGNNRVLIWDGVPSSNGSAAAVVLGQPNFSTGAAPVSPTPNSMKEPVWLHHDDDTGRLFVVDRGHNRIMVWNALPSENNVPADYFIGQGGGTSGLTNAGSAGPNAFGFKSPSAAITVAGSLLVSDEGNHRVVAFTPIPSSSGEPAITVLGQPNLDSDAISVNTPNRSQILTPDGLAVVGDKLFVVDQFWHRVLRFQLDLPQN